MSAPLGTMPRPEPGRGAEVLVGAVDIYSNHAMIFVGAAAFPEVEQGDSAASADDRHVVVRTRGQVALTRVSIWSLAMPYVGAVVFDGELDLTDHTLWVGDAERLTSYTTRLIGSTGPQRVVVCVDDPGHASRIHVGLGLGTEVTTLTSVAGHPLPDVLTASAADLYGVNGLGLLLDDHDSPLARLAGAVRFVARPPTDEREWPDPYQVMRIAEWLRRLGPDVSFEKARTLSEKIAVRLRASRGAVGDGIPDEVALAIASDVLDRIHRIPTG
jgi:hypothetical protein